MATLAKLAVELSLVDKFSNGLNETRSTFNKWGKELRDTGKQFVTKLSLPVAAGFAFMVKSASDLNETMTATESVFGSSAKEIKAWAKTADRALGLSQESALQAATTFAGMGKSAGLTGNDLVDFSEQLVTSAADLSSFWNMPSGQVLDDLRSGLAGESEPLRKYNIFLTEADVAQRAMLMSGKANADQLTAGEKIAARAALIQEQLGDATGDFAKTSGGLANKLRILRARVKNVAAALGVQLLPYVLKGVELFMRLIDWFDKLSPRIKTLTLVVLALAAAIGPALIAFGLMLPAISVLLGPLGLVLVAVGLLAAAFATDFLGIRSAVGGVVESLMHLWTYMELAFKSGTGVSQLVGFLPGPLKKVGKGFLLIADAVGDLYAAFKSGGMSELLDALPGELDQVWEGLSILAAEGFGKLKEAFLSIPWTDIGLAALDLGKIAFAAIPWDTIWDNVTTLGNGIKRKVEELDYHNLGFQIGSGLRTAVEAIGPTFLDIGGRVVTFLKDGLEDHWKEILIAVALWPAALVTAIGSLADTLGPPAKDFISGFLEGIGTSWEDVTAWLNTRDEAALLAIGALTATLLQKGKDLIDGLRDGASDQWNVFTGWLKNRGIIAASWIGDVSQTLLNKGKSLIQGLRDGALDKWDTFTEWLEGRPDAIKGWIGDLSSLLYGAGQDAVQGLINGAKSKIPGLTTVVDSLIAIWNRIPKQGNSPWPVMIGAGKDAVDGLIIGADSRMDKLNDTIGNITAAMLAPMGADSSGVNYGGVTNYFTITESKDAKATANETFAIFAREMALTTGGV